MLGVLAAAARVAAVLTAAALADAVGLDRVTWRRDGDEVEVVRRATARRRHGAAGY